MSKIKLTINDKEVMVEEGQTILEVAKEVGVDIPVLCHHPALTNWGACRMCLVEVEGMRGLQPACTCPATEGMKIQTETEQVVNVRKFILELLFSERNHYCMFCQLSGDCELQDAAYRYGLEHFTYPRSYEKFEIDASRKYFIMDPNRCILCSRCIRACAEIAANHTLNLKGRGAGTRVIADLNVPLGESTCIECGTCLQVCPTGALIAVRSAYGGRKKDVTHTETTCLQCSVGCKLNVVTRYERLLHVDGIFGSEPNDGLLCVKGRFEPLYDEDRQRVKTPLVRKDGQLQKSSWEEVLPLVSAKLTAGTAQGLAATATTNEAFQAFGKLFEKVGGPAGLLCGTLPELGYGEGAAIQDVLAADYIVVAGTKPLTTHKVVGYFIKRAADNGATIALVGEPENELCSYAKLNVPYTEADKVIADVPVGASTIVVYGAGLTAEGIAALKPLAEKATFLGLEPGRNGRGAAAAGLTPLAPSAAETLLVLLGEHPVNATWVEKLAGAFTVVQASYLSPLTAKADVVLPTPIWVERNGHVTNLEGKVLPLQAALELPSGVRDETEVLIELAQLIG
ncbi:MAG: molybdopterin-dependent oxidoreductase [Anaerolineae bacterium]|nr:molybdopterin-dependent oxidoreductase [Anaerolineae bacterium]